MSDLSNNEAYYRNQFNEALNQLSDLNRQYLADYLPAVVEVSSLTNSSDGFSEHKALSEDSLALNIDRQEDVSLQSNPDSEASSNGYLQTPLSGDMGAVLEGSSLNPCCG